MTAFVRNKQTRRVALGAALTVLMLASAGRAADITVCKTTGEDACMFKTIQEAVNAAKPGQVIEIMDAAVYKEQVTIDGRGEWNSASEWNGKNQGPVKDVKGGKNGITIQYKPTGARLFGTHDRPTIEWKDTENRSPKNYTESKAEGQLPGQSGNFETNGALRILWAQGVTIDGIKVDGGGMAPFENKAVWDSKYPLFHGNAAITIAVAGGAVIRNCDITNGYFGINIKDRNTGGVFGNPNPADNDKTIPLSGFGKVGNHLFEYNKIHNNFTGMFFESSWDLGSTIRYNLIYSNIHTTSALPTMEDPSNAVGGAILFKDVKYTPVAIYNNTFFNNTGNIMAGWKVAAPHLLFNNIFSKPSYALGVQSAQPNSVQNASFEHRFPYRMHNSLFAATADLKSEQRHIQNCKKDAVRDETGKEITPGIYGQQITGITQVRISNNFPNPTPSNTQVECTGALAGTMVSTTEFIAPGAPLTGTLFSTAANIRWLETTKSISGTEDLFVSVTPTSADFLRPKWDNPQVEKFIKGQGWKDIGIKNSDGSAADIGAISSNGRALAVEARVKPSNVVLVNGTKAKASFFVSVENGQMNNAKISFLRWVAPLPTTPAEPSGNAAPPVLKDSIHTITAPATAVAVNGNNTMEFNISQLPALARNDTSGQYGFFEIVVTGKDASGNDVVSDIGFLPYRKLEYTLKMTVHQGSSATPVTEVKAGEPYRLHVVPCKGSDPANCGSYTDGPLSEISYELQSNAAAFMYNVSDNKPFTQDGPSPSANMTSSGKDYNVYFTRAGKETIMGSGVANISGGGRLVFLGTLDITVKPGAPAKIVFTDPIPSSQLGGALPPVINRGVDRPVLVEVQDKYENAVDVPVQVSIVSDKPEIGDVATKTVTTAGTTGVATFIAKTGPTAASGQIFEMTASFTSGSASGSDKGKLRVGKALDRLEVFYSDNGPGKEWKKYYDPTVAIDGAAGEWYQISVKVLVGDSVNTARPNQFVLVSPNDDNLIFSATEGGAAADVFALNNGVAAFWVSTKPGANKDINNAGISVYALSSNNADAIDQSIQSGGRDNINFKTPSSAISHAVVYGDGQGRPESVLITYKEGSASLTAAGVKLPSTVTLNWSGVTLTASGAAITAKSDLVLSAVFTGADRPAGKTSITGLGTGLVEVTGGAGGAASSEKSFDVYDGIGPLLANGDPSDGAGGGSPKIYENLTGGNDTLIVTLSEELRDPSKLKTLLYTAAANPGEPASATAGTKLEVLDAKTANGRTFTLIVRHTADGPIPGGWIRLDPGSVTDQASTQSMAVVSDNSPHDRNRWVQLKLQQGTPIVMDAWYTINNAAGTPDYANVLFNKEVELNYWFIGGSVNFGSEVKVPDAAALSSTFSVVDGGKTLRIDLTAAKQADAASKKIRTTGDMPFKLSFAKGIWKNDNGDDDPNLTVTLSVTAKDRAAPVLAKAAVLKTGSLKVKNEEGGDDEFNSDTLTVYYSEQLSARMPGNPLELKLGGSISAPPELKLLGAITQEGGLYKARYEVIGKLNTKPVSGDSVHIYAEAGIGDNMDPVNVQDDPKNKWQPLIIDRSSNWTARIKNNPIMSGGGSDPMVVAVWANMSEPNVIVRANIRIFDNVGALVVDTAITTDKGIDQINWTWRGQNSKGRLVGSGIYLLKALCESDVAGQKDKYKVEKKLGVVRGKQ